MQIRFLEIDENESFLLGFPLKLTPTERRILLTIAQSGNASTDDLIRLLSSGVTRENVTVHICSINKKAHAISGRKLILFGNRQYKINEYM